MRRFYFEVPSSGRKLNVIAVNLPEAHAIAKWMIQNPKKVGIGSLLGSEIFLNKTKILLS